MFRKCNPNKDMTFCPQEGWLALFKESDMARGHKHHYNIVNIGFNKGYNFATWLNVFAPSSNVDARVWYDGLKGTPGITKGDLCGACSDCKAAPFASATSFTAAHSEPALHIVGVDLNKHNLDVVATVMQKLRNSHNISESKLSLKLIHAAAGSAGNVSALSDAPKKMKIPKCEAGNELCKIPDSSDPAVTDYEYVDIVGVDDLVQHLPLIKRHLHDGSLHLKMNVHGSRDTKLSLASTALRKPSRAQHTGHMLDILHIDTEGNDCEVLKTATETLKAQLVRALIFEYHHFGPWKHTQLKDVVASIALHNMECYFMGLNRLWPITGKCWDPQYEFHDWSNVMCVLRSDPWHQAIQPLVQTVTSLRAPFPDGTLFKAYRAAAIYLVQDGKRRGFANKDAFDKQKYTTPVVATQHCNVAYLFPDGDLIQ